MQYDFIEPVQMALPVEGFVICLLTVYHQLCFYSRATVLHSDSDWSCANLSDRYITRLF